MPISVCEERLIQSEKIFAGKVINLRVDSTVMIKNGREIEARREVIEHLPSVVVVPLSNSGEILLVEQYRHATGERLLEAPAGGIENIETPLQAASRELQEETGYAPGQLTTLGSFWIAPGWCNEYMHAYLATELSLSQLDQDEDEDVKVVPVPLNEVSGLIREGHIQDAKSIAALLMVLHLAAPSTSKAREALGS